jgi:hypothetical protein
MALKPWEGRFGEVRFNATDVATAVYSLFVLLFVLLFRARIPEAGLHALFNADVVLLVLLVCLLKEKWNGFRVVWLWYPLALYTFFYYQSGLLNRALVPHFLDDPFLAADVRIFGEFPGFLLHRAFPGAVANEVFHFAYFCYYLIIPFAGILLYRKGHDLFARYLLEVSVLFYVCYAIFIFLPVEGPLHLRNGFFHGSGVFERIVDFLYRKGENPGGAFPSSHVAVAWLVAWWSFRHLPGVSRVLIPLVALLSLATVYGMFHYGVDVLAGMAMALGTILVFRQIS